MDSIFVHPRYEAFLYDGTNSEELLDQLNSYLLEPAWEVVSLVSGTAEFRLIVFNDIYTVEPGHLAVVQGSNGPGASFYSPELFATQFVTSGDVVTAVLPDPILAAGVASVPSLNGGASTTVEVTIYPTLPDTGYTPAALLIGSTALLASLSVTATSKVSGSRTDVTVQNTGLLPLSGASVLLAAVDQS